jgi:hypothetical protein
MRGVAARPDPARPLRVRLGRGGARPGDPRAQVAISLAEAEAGSIEAASPALEEHRAGLTAELRASPYLTRFPASLDPSPFATTLRFREPATGVARLPDWWPGATGPLVYVSYGACSAT